MNKRIQELAKQSGWKTDSMSAVNAVAQEQKLEKFAQLIIEECASKVDWILAEGGKTQGDLIREHFGVKK